MIICIDVDNVVNNLIDVAIDYYNKEKESTISLNDISTYNIYRCLDYSSANEISAWIDSRIIWNKVKPISGAASAIQRMIDAGHEVYFVTYNAPLSWDAKVAWIKKNFPYIDADHIVCMKHKWRFDCDVMVEDCVETLIKSKQCQRICLDYPWNRNIKDHVYGIHRVMSWDDVTNVIEIMNETME